MAQRKKKGFESYFENHVAKIINLSDITIIDYFNPKYQVQYNVRFIFDKKNCSLAITGDFGNLTAQNYYNLGDYHKTYEHFCNSPEYFVKKIKSFDRNIFSYDEDEAKEYILKHILSEDFNKLDKDDQKSFAELFEYFNDSYGFQHLSDGSIEWLKKYDPDYWELLPYAGRNISCHIYLLLDAYRRAYEYLKKENDYGTTEDV